MNYNPCIVTRIHRVLETHLESLFGFLGDAAFRGEECWRRRRHCDFWWELGNGGRDEKLWHVGRDTGADSVGVWKLRLVIAGILLLVWKIGNCKYLSSFINLQGAFRGADLGMAVRCYMWPVLPGTSRLLTPGTEIQWRVSSVDKGATPAVGTKVPLRAPPAPLWAKSTHQQTVGILVFFVCFFY